jgi:hypothetical protein
MIGDAAQYQELVALYGSYGDQELIALGRGMADLTEMAQEALKGELTRRGLKVAPAKTAETRILTEDDLADMRRYAEVAPAECIFDFDDERTASAAYYALLREGIESIVVAAGGAKRDNRGLRVVVKPNDAERATEILSAPSGATLRAEMDEAAAEYDLPLCPACGGEETVLESVDPVNRWLCEECEHRWVEEPALHDE